MDSADWFQSQLEAELKEVRAYQVHGAGFYEVGFSLAGDTDGSVRRARISDNLIYSNPQIGDQVWIEILMGNVARVVRRG